MPGDDNTALIGIALSPQCRRRDHAECTKDGCICECHDPPVVTWEEPPTVIHPGRHGWIGTVLTDEVVETLKAHPGRWAKVHAGPDPTYKTIAAVAFSLRKGKRYGPGWDATSRKSGADTALYVRWNPADG